MYRVLIPGLILTSVIFSSCGFYEHRERQMLFNEITATNDSLDKLVRGWHQALEKAVFTKNFSTLGSERIKIGQFFSRRRSLIANLELPPDAHTLRESEDVFLTAQSVMVTDVYPRFEPFNDLTPRDTIQARRKLVAADQDTELAWKLTIKKSLDAFAIKNNLKSSKK